MEGGYASVERMGAAEYARYALLEVLGSKQDRSFRPGRYVDNLKSRKKSVTRFVASHQEMLAASREGTLSVEFGTRLLEVLRESEMVPGSAGDKFLESVISSLRADDFIPGGVVEAAVWKRDPWEDLTHSRDFYSSASLRGDSFMDSLERRSKGMLGPFGYLRNKSLSALDFKTSEGRSVRARLAAATFVDSQGGERPVLFVDAVEGRFEIKPALVRHAVEGYARAAGFDRVFYHRYPLNRVPARFVSYLVDSDACLEELEIEYVDAVRREYLDAFGLPLEPLEYAYPKGRVIGYSVDTGGGLDREPVVPGPLKLALYAVKDKGLLWAMVLSSFAGLGWMLERFQPDWLLPAGAICAFALAYELVISPHIRRKIRRRIRREIGSEESTADSEDTPEPAFVRRIVQAIGRNEDALKSSYPARLAPKVAKLTSFFERPGASLAPFFEAILYNMSMKDSHIENGLKFVAKPRWGGAPKGLGVVRVPVAGSRRGADRGRAVRGQEGPHGSSEGDDSQDRPRPQLRQTGAARGLGHGGAGPGGKGVAAAARAGARGGGASPVYLAWPPEAAAPDVRLGGSVGGRPVAGAWVGDGSTGRVLARGVLALDGGGRGRHLACLDPPADRPGGIVLRGDAPPGASSAEGVVAPVGRFGPDEGARGGHRAVREERVLRGQGRRDPDRDPGQAIRKGGNAAADFRRGDRQLHRVEELRGLVLAGVAQ